MKLNLKCHIINKNKCLFLKQKYIELYKKWRLIKSLFDYYSDKKDFSMLIIRSKICEVLQQSNQMLLCKELD